MKYLRRFLLKLTLEKLCLTEEDKTVMKSHSKNLREVDYKWFTHKAYASNDQSIRMAAI